MIHTFFKELIQNNNGRDMVELTVVQTHSGKRVHIPSASEPKRKDPVSNTTRKEIIRLFQETRLSLREIARIVKTSHATVSRVTEEAKWPQRIQERLNHFFDDGELVESNVIPLKAIGRKGKGITRFSDDDDLEEEMKDAA